MAHRSTQCPKKCDCRPAAGMRLARWALIFLVVCVIAGSSSASAQQSPAEPDPVPPGFLFDGALSETVIAPEAFGERWVLTPGLAVNDLSELSQLALGDLNALADRSIVGYIEHWGFSAYSEWCYAFQPPQTNVPNTVTVNVYVFKSVDACTKWWAYRYTRRAIAGQYRALQDTVDTGVLYVLKPAAAVRSGNFVIVASQSARAKNFLGVLASYMRHFGLNPISPRRIKLVAPGDMQIVDPLDGYHFSGKLSELGRSPRFLGDGWSQVHVGHLIDDLSNLNTLPQVHRSGARQLARQLRPRGVRSVAQFIFIDDARRRSVTLRIFLFHDKSNAGDWWQQRFLQPNWRKTYQPALGLGHDALFLRGRDKLAMRMGNVVMTCEQAHEGNDIQRVVAEYMYRMGAPKPKVARIQRDKPLHRSKLATPAALNDE